MAFQEIRDFLIRFRTDASGVQQGNAQAARSFTEVNSAIELVQKGLRALNSAGEVLARGNNYNQIARGFESISKSVGILADDQLTKLRAAVGGTVSDLQLMEQANKAVLLGLDATKLDVMAEAAQRLGAALGRTGTEAFQDLVTGVGRGSALILDNLGIIVNAEDAYKKFAKELGVTADQLNEAGKKAAFQEAALKAIKERAELLPAPVQDAGRAFEELKAAVENFKDQVAGAISGSTELAKGINYIRDAVIDAIPYMESFAKGLATVLGSDSIDSQSIRNNATIGLRGKLAETLGAIPLIGPQLAAAQKKEIDELTKVQAGLNAERQKQLDQKVRDQLVAELLTHTDLSAALKTNKDKYTDHTAASKDAAKASEALEKKLKDQKKAYEDLTFSLKENSLKHNLEKALEKVDVNSFNRFFDEYGTAFAEHTEKKLLEQLGDPAKAKELTRQMLDLERGEAYEELQARVERAFQGSVDFFSDLLTPMFEGQAANFEDIFLDAAKRVAIGFTSQVAASFAAQLGFSNLGNIGSAGGLGQMLAAYLGFGGPGGSGGSGGGAGWMDLIDLASTAYSAYSSLGLGTSAVSSTSAIMADYATISGLYEGAASLYGTSAATTAGVGAAGAGVIGGSLTTAGVAAAVVAQLYSSYLGYKSFEKRKDDNESMQAYQDLGSNLTIPFWQLRYEYGPSEFTQSDDANRIMALMNPASPGFAFALAETFGINFFGDNPDKINRRRIRTALQETGLGEELSFKGINGRQSIFDSGFVEDPSNPLNASAIALANPIATAFMGGEDSAMTTQLAAMFADATDNAENFNEVLINTRSLMDQMGTNSEQLKEQLTTLFLDGKISVEELGEGIAQLNLLATDNLVGPNSISDAVNIMAKNIDSDPRVAIKGLELAFKEMAEVGIDSQAEIRDYISNNFSPDVIAAFDKLLSSGVDTWQEIAQAGPDAIFLIADALRQLESAADKSASNVGDTIASNIGAAADKAGQKIDALNKKLSGLNSPTITSSDPNQPNNARPA